MKKLILPHNLTIHPGSSESPEDRSISTINIHEFFPQLSGFSEVDFREDHIILPSKIPVIPTRRLVVVITAGELDEYALARRIWQLAVGSNLQVLYITRVQDDRQAIYQHRRLAVLAAMTSDHQISAQVQVSREKSWPRTIAKIGRNGDLLVCLASHRVREGLLRRRSLGKLLANSTSIPVYLIGDLKVSRVTNHPQHYEEALAWIASLILIVTFSGLQVEIQHSLARSLSTILFYLSVLIEIYILYKINAWIG
jgi:nucleotide-binding universal stress UspA family protein